MERKNNNNIKDAQYRCIKFVFGCMLLFFLACLVKLIWLVVAERTIFNGTSDQCLDKTVPGWDTTALAHDTSCQCIVKQNELRPMRGDIYDDHGRLLAGNYNIFDITIDGRVLVPKTYTKGQKTIVNDTLDCGNGRKFSRSGSPKQVDALIEELATAFYQHFHVRFPKRSLAYYRNKFTQAIKEGKNAALLSSNRVKESQWITPEDTAFVSHLPLLRLKRRGGLNYTTIPIRTTPYGEMAKRTIGMYYIPKDSSETKRTFGIESAFNKELEGQPGAQKYLFYNNARIPLNDYSEPSNGYNVNTTINLEIQNIVHTELEHMLIEQQAEWGCAVVMETKTGEIKAISNLTANKDKTKYAEGVQNYAITKMVEPGSTFKLASLLAYLERTDNDSCEKVPLMKYEFERKNRNGKSIFYEKYDKPGHDGYFGRPIDAFQQSSNVGIAHMVFSKYSIYHYENYLKKIDSLFITTSFTTQLGKINPPNIKRRATDFHSYYNTCFGTGFTMPPIQTLIYYNAVANNGKMILPLFVKSITNQEDTIKKFEAEVICEQICKPSTIKKAKKYLEAVVYGEHGTARSYNKIPKIRFAGKTGTRDIWDEATGTYLKNKNSVSFCGYFPAENPKYTCIVFLYNIPIKSSVAVKVFANIVKRISEEANTDNLPAVPKQKGHQMPRFNATNAAQLNTILEVYGIHQTKKYTSPYVRSGFYSDNTTFVKGIPWNAKAKLPDLKGLNAADAVYELSKRGRRAKIIGRGFVKDYTTASDGKTVILHLEPN